MSYLFLKNVRIFNFAQKTSAQTITIMLTAAFIMITGNKSFFTAVLNAYPLSLASMPFLISLTLFFTSLTIMFFLIVCHGRLTRWVLAFILIVASQSAYYMDSLGVVIDTVMIDNAIQSSFHEFAGLVTSDLVFRTIIFGIIPSWVVIKYCPDIYSFKTEFKSRLNIILFLLLVIIVSIVTFSRDYTSFITEHKAIRYYANPNFPLYSGVKYTSQSLRTSKHASPLIHIADDAIKNNLPGSKKKLMILVVGETARADRFSLNGYKRDTNPMLSQQQVISFSHVTSCGTSTSVSVPCMFSSLGRKKYDKEKALAQENVLDVLKNNGVEILWRDNNSDSKGVATRVRYEDFKTSTLNPDCKGECRDIGMLSGLENFIKLNNNKDLLIVLHQMGSHGPRYYERYPKDFERFKPACHTGELNDCSQQEIDNAYDNVVLYTDYFLSEVINLLKKYDNNYAAAMLYVSDHGESLGEHGVYLHAAPYIFAPKEQTQVPAIFWAGKHFNISAKDIFPFRHAQLSHDDLFCSLLLSYNLITNICNAKSATQYPNSY